MRIDKTEVLAFIIRHLETDINVAEKAVEVARDTATHKDCLGSSKYETMGTEASYLAKGQGERLLELRRALAYFNQLQPKLSESIELASLVVLENEDGKQQHLLLAADAGGLKVSHQQQTITVITPQAPLGRVLMGKQVGDLVSLNIAATAHDYEVISVL